MLDDDCREQSFNSIMVLSFPKFFLGIAAGNENISKRA
jgi:hypothetical protein